MEALQLDTRTRRQKVTGEQQTAIKQMIRTKAHVVVIEAMEAELFKRFCESLDTREQQSLHEQCQLTKLFREMLMRIDIQGLVRD